METPAELSQSGKLVERRAVGPASQRPARLFSRLSLCDSVCPPASERQAALQLDDAAGQPAVGASEVRVFDERREEAERVQVQVVEGVEDVGAYLKEGALAHEGG